MDAAQLLSSPPPPRTSSIPPGLVSGLVVAGKYELTRRLGTGTMGEVWAARHVSLDEEIAIKLVVRDVAHGDGTRVESRFLLEARLAATLARKTRHIVNVTDHGEDGHLAYLVMELLEGESLEDRMQRTGPLPLAKAIPILTQIARGLAVAHGEGVVHRDLKPSNVFITCDEDGIAVAKILDFGIAKLRSSVRRMRVEHGDLKHATMAGFLLGTPAFMSPEQACGRTPDHRADVWALAVIAYFLLTNELPFDAETLDELLSTIASANATPVRRYAPNLPRAVDDFFAKAFAQSLEERFQSALALATAFAKLEPMATSIVSLPPPPVRTSPESAPALQARLAIPPAPIPRHTDSAMVVAGLPPRPRLRPRVAAALLAACAMTAATVRLAMPSHPVAHPMVQTAEAPAPAATMAGRDDVPPPPPLAVAATPSPVVVPTEPPAVKAAPRPTEHRSESLVRSIAATLPGTAAPSNPPTPAAPAPSPTVTSAPPRVVDRGAIF